MTKKEFQLLCTFLRDRNEHTRTLVQQQIRIAIQSYPHLRELIADFTDPQVRTATQTLLEDFHYEELDSLFAPLLAQGPRLDLEQALYLLARLEYPSLKKSDIKDPLDKMAADVDQLMGTQAPMPTRAVSAMRTYLFDTKKFRGNEENYYDPNNLFLNYVLKHKIGIPISLSCVYLLVGWRLRLLVQGIGLPGHFLVGHRIPRGVVYIDPFQGGKQLRVKDCEMLVRRLGIPFQQAYLDPANNQQILSRMLVNLINIYTDQKRTRRAQWLASLFQKFS